MANEQNLKPFAIGEDSRRNIDGRPVGAKSRSTVARKILDMLVKIPNEDYIFLKQNFPDLAQSVTIEEYITMQQTVLATKETAAYKAVMDSAYGLPKAEIEHSGDATFTVALNVIKSDAPRPVNNEKDIADV